MYGEYFDIPQPDELVFISSFSGGEVFRSGCSFTRGFGHIFYFSPGHETYPIYYQPEVQRVMCNAVRWLAPQTWGRGRHLRSRNAPAGWLERGSDEES
jgi:trehalose utilization protein